MTTQRVVADDARRGPILAGDVPPTERILGRLPGPRWSWILAWGAVLPVALLVAPAPLEPGDAWSSAARGGWSRLSASLGARGPALLAAIYAVPHALWAVGHVTRRAVEASAALAAVQLEKQGTATVTRGMGNVAGPLGAAVGLGLLAAVATASWRGAAHVALAPVLALVLLPQITLLWVYLSLMLGLFRLGSHPLALEQYSGDRSLGLGPVGRVAFAGFWSFVANFAPLTLLAFGGRSRVDLAIASAFLVLGTFAIFGSLLRVRAQMTTAKRKQLARARHLYAEAYEPLRSHPSLEVLQRQAPLLAAADALEKRAEGIQRWPFSDALLARAVVVATSVVAAVITRLAQRFLGL